MTNYDLNSDDSLDLKSKLHRLCLCLFFKMVQLIKSIEYIDMTSYDLNSDDSLDLKSKLNCIFFGLWSQTADKLTIYLIPCSWIL